MTHKKSHNKTRKRPINVSIKVNDAEHRELHDFAKFCVQSYSEFIRQAITERKRRLMAYKKNETRWRAVSDE